MNALADETALRAQHISGITSNPGVETMDNSNPRSDEQAYEQTQANTEQPYTPTTLREALDVIDRVLMQGDTTARALWFVLSALRGPDSGNYKVKHSTTVHIRQAAFPLAAAHQGSIDADMQPAFSIADAYGPCVESESSHFRGHIYKAYRVLNIGPDSSNNG